MLSEVGLLLLLVKQLGTQIPALYLSNIYLLRLPRAWKPGPHLTSTASIIMKHALTSLHHGIHTWCWKHHDTHVPLISTT